MEFEVTLNEAVYTVQGRIRPNCEEFLREVSNHFEVVLFTASQKIYAQRVIEKIDPMKKYIKHKLYRDHCVFVNGQYLKHLDVLGRDLSQTILVDNSILAFGYHLSNGIPISSWYDDDKDIELLRCLKFLESVKDVDDVRTHIAKAFGVEKIIKG